MRGLRALVAVDNLELDALALIEGAETVHVNARVVNEHVSAATINLDEAETLFGVEPFN